jgi:alpha-tubulin suppressor-like RCC1 family protein
MANDLWCWGRNKAGALGNGNTSGGTALTPTKVLNVSNVVSFDLAHRTGCAVDSAERLFCWGNNFRGQILGGDARTFTPVEVKP